MEEADTAVAHAAAEESNSLLPIWEWIHLSKLAEQQQQQQASGNNGGESSSSTTVENLRKSQLDYTKRSTIVATLILERLLPPDGDSNTGGRSLCAIYRTQDIIISIDNIHLDLDCDDVHSLKRQLSSIKSNNNNCLEDLISKLQCVRGVKISLHESAEQSNDNGDNDDKQSTTAAATTITEIFQRIGYILYILFARGEEPPSFSPTTTATISESAEDVMSNARRRMRCRDDDDDDDDDESSHQKNKKNDDDDESDKNNNAYEEHAGANKGRQKLCLNETTKTFRRLNILSDIVEDRLSGKYGVPNSICRLISDLIIPPENMDDRFVSILEVLDELQQIVKRPDVYLSNGENGTTTTRSFQFCEGIVGRQHEIGMLLEASARTQINNDTSHICLIGGMAGVGKSYLVTSVKDVLTSHGWIYLSCKFDRLMRNQPLATIASTMEYFIQQLILQRGGGGGPSNRRHWFGGALLTTVMCNFCQFAICTNST
jgi:hypothetical protein